MKSRDTVAVVTATPVTTAAPFAGRTDDDDDDDDVVMPPLLAVAVYASPTATSQ